MNHTGTVTAAKATSATITLGSEQAQTAVDVRVAKAETLTIVDNKGATINANSDFSLAKTIDLTTKGTLTLAEALPAAVNVTATGTGSKAKLDANGIIGATDLSNDLTITASGFDAGFDTVGGGIDAGAGNLTLNLNGISKGAITTGSIQSDATLTLNADTIGTLTTGATGGKAVVIDAADVLGTTSFGTITSDSLTMSGSGIVANTVTVGGSTSTAAATAMTVDYTGGILVDTVNVNGTTSTNSITVKGDAGLGTDIYNVTLADYGTLGTATTVTVDLSGVVADTTTQSTVTVDIANEADNAMTLTGSKGNNDTIATTSATNATYSEDLTISGFEKLTITNDIQFTAASLSGVTIDLGSSAASKIVTLQGTANADTLTYANITNAGGNTPLLKIVGGDGADTITTSALADDIVINDDDATDSVSSFDVNNSGVDDEIMIDITALATELGAGTIASEAGSAAIGTGQAALKTMAAGASTGTTGSAEEIYKITDTTGIDSNADLTGDITLSANIGNAADGILVLWYDEDGEAAVLSIAVDAGAAVDANVDLAGATFTDLVTISMSATDYGNLDADNFEVI